MPSPQVAAAILILPLVPIAAPTVCGADEPRAATPNDGDYLVQGEYQGSARIIGPCARQVGMQIVALGEGKFRGTLYHGGLPGAGWDRKTAWQLHAERGDQGLELTGPTLSLLVKCLGGHDTPRRAVLTNPKGELVGQLRKISRASPTLAARPPRNAMVLFDATPHRLAGATLTPDGLLNVGASTETAVGDFYLHMEFRTPFEPQRRGQGRGNSGVYIQRRYEVQILDSFGLAGDANECGGLYRQRKPDVNMCLPPLVWQTYDIDFTTARWDRQGRKIANARLTVRHNGVVVHNDIAITNKTGAGKPEGPEKLPILWQDHGNPVHFRNIWLIVYDQRVASSSPGRFRLRDRLSAHRLLGRQRRGRNLRASTQQAEESLPKRQSGAALFQLASNGKLSPDQSVGLVLEAAGDAKR